VVLGNLSSPAYPLGTHDEQVVTNVAALAIIPSQPIDIRTRHPSSLATSYLVPYIMLPSQPHSLFVRDRTQASDPAGTSIDHLRDEMQFLRESKEYRLAIEKELEVWMELLMESESVDEALLKRSVRHIRMRTYTRYLH
jgi:hypothetical protein